MLSLEVVNGGYPVNRKPPSFRQKFEVVFITLQHLEFLGSPAIHTSMFSIYSLLLSWKYPDAHFESLLNSDMMFSEIKVSKNYFPEKQSLNMWIFHSFVYIILHLLSFNFTSHFNHSVTLARLFCNSPEPGSDLIIPNSTVVFKTIVNSIFIPFHFMRNMTNNIV